MALSSKTALVTGGTKNLGAEIAWQLAQSGANLALHHNSPFSEDAKSALLNRLGDFKVQIHFYQGDLTTSAKVDELFAAVKKDFGRIDVVVNTVGKVLKKPITEISEAEYDQMFAVNSKSAFFILKASALHIENGGKIVTLATALLAAYTGYYTTYAGSKAPVEHFTRGVAKELQGRGVSVNAVAPGPMDTPFFYPQETPESISFLKGQAMDGRLTDIKDIAPLIRFLCTEGGWVTGQTIFASGGFVTR